MKKVLIDEIISRKEAHDAHKLLYGRFVELYKLLLNTPDDSELLRYFPVSLVATLEATYRTVVKELIDEGEPYFSRVQKIVKELTFNYEVIIALQGRALTVGEVVAYQLPFNNIKNIFSTLDNLLDGNSSKLLANVKRKEGELILKDPEKVFRSVETVFLLRHEICHTSGAKIEVTSADIRVLANDLCHFAEALVGVQK